MKEFLSEERTNKEIYKFTLLEGFLPTHTTQILGEIEKSNYLKVRSVNGEARKKKAYYINYGDNERVGVLYEQHKN